MSFCVVDCLCLSNNFCIAFNAGICKVHEKIDFCHSILNMTIAIIAFSFVSKCIRLIYAILRCGGAAKLQCFEKLILLIR